MRIELVTPFGVKRSVEVYEVILPTTTGIITILPSHEPLVTLLDHGVMMIRYKKTDPDDAMDAMAVARGIVEIADNTVRILANEAEEGSEIIEHEVKSAMKRAEKMKAGAKNKIELEKASKILQRQTNRLKVAELHRRRRHKRPGTLPPQ